MRPTPLLLALTAVVAAGCAPSRVATTPEPAPQPGERIRYATLADSSRLVTTRLVAIDADSMRVERYRSDVRPRRDTLSIPSDSLARLQVKVGTRRHPVEGALIGTAVGAGVGLLCVLEEESGWGAPTDEECFFGFTLLGTGTGLLIGTIVRTTVWAPATVPSREPEVPARQAPPAVSARPIGIGVRFPIRLPAP